MNGTLHVCAVGRGLVGAGGFGDFVYPPMIIGKQNSSSNTGRVPSLPVCGGKEKVDGNTCSTCGEKGEDDPERQNRRGSTAPSSYFELVTCS